LKHLTALVLLLAGSVWGQIWQPTDYQEWRDSANERKHKAYFSGSIQNYQKADNSWAAIENDWITVDDTLHTNRKAALKTDVNDAGQATVSLMHDGKIYTVSQRLLKVIWINTATHNWTDIADVSWSTPSVDSNIVRWGNVIPGVDYAIKKTNGQVAHGIIFKPAFLDSAVTLYNQREDSLDIALGNVIAYELTNVDDADSAIGNVDSRTLKDLGRYAFSLTRQAVHFPGSDTLPSVYVKQRWIKKNNKIYCVEYVPMSRIKQIHAMYPNAVIWHNTTTTVTGDPDFREGTMRQAEPTMNYGGSATFEAGYYYFGYGPTWRTSYFWVDKPNGTNWNLIACSLWAYCIWDHYETEDTTDIYYCTRPNAQNYVGDNNDVLADSAEMNWNNLFEGGSGDDTAWTVGGGDHYSTVLGAVVIGAGEYTWQHWVLDSATIDSVLKETLANQGYILKARGLTSPEAEDACYKVFRSTQYTGTTYDPYWIYVYEEVEEEEAAPNRRRRLLIGE